MRQKEIKESSKVNPRLSYKLRKERELLKQEYYQSNQRMLRQLLKSRLENNTDHLQKKQLTFRIEGYNWNDVEQSIHIAYDHF